MRLNLSPATQLGTKIKRGEREAPIECHHRQDSRELSAKIHAKRGESVVRAAEIMHAVEFAGPNRLAHCLNRLRTSPIMALPRPALTPEQREKYLRKMRAALNPAPSVPEGDQSGATTR